MQMKTIQNCLKAIMSHYTTRSFEIICRGRKVGLAGHTMCSFYKWQLFDTMYHISTISDILRQGVDYLDQWLEH